MGLASLIKDKISLIYRRCGLISNPQLLTLLKLFARHCPSKRTFFEMLIIRFSTTVVDSKVFRGSASTSILCKCHLFVVAAIFVGHWQQQRPTKKWHAPSMLVQTNPVKIINGYKSGERQSYFNVIEVDDVY